MKSDLNDRLFWIAIVSDFFFVWEVLWPILSGYPIKLSFSEISDILNILFGSFSLVSVWHSVVTVRPFNLRFFFSNGCKLIWYLSGRTALTWLSARNFIFFTGRGSYLYSTVLCCFLLINLITEGFCNFSSVFDYSLALINAVSLLYLISFIYFIKSNFFFLFSTVISALLISPSSGSLSDPDSSSLPIPNKISSFFNSLKNFRKRTFAGRFSCFFYCLVFIPSIVLVYLFSSYIFDEESFPSLISLRSWIYRDWMSVSPKFVYSYGVNSMVFEFLV